MNRFIIPTAFAAVLTGLVSAAANQSPFAFLAVTINLGERERERLEAGQDIVKVLPGGDREVAVVAAIRTSASPGRLIEWTRDIVGLRRSRYVPLIAKFSDPPRIEDVEALALEDSDLEDLRTCRPASCGLKLGAEEMARLQQQFGRPHNWKEAVQQEFRRLVVDRVRAYLRDGDFGLPSYDDHSIRIVATAEVAALTDTIGLVSPRLPGVAEYLQLYPRLQHPAVVDSLVYWSKETFGGKPVISVTHVILLSIEAGGHSSVLAISKQLLATHYRTGALSVTAITDTPAGRYLVYTQRSHVDVLRGMFGGLLRRMLERRVRDEAPIFLFTTRGRLEGGAPPGQDALFQP